MAAAAALSAIAEQQIILSQDFAKHNTTGQSGKDLDSDYWGDHSDTTIEYRSDANDYIQVRTSIDAGGDNKDRFIGALFHYKFDNWDLGIVLGQGMRHVAAQNADADFMDAVFCNEDVLEQAAPYLNTDGTWEGGSSCNINEIRAFYSHLAFETSYQFSHDFRLATNVSIEELRDDNESKNLYGEINLEKRFDVGVLVKFGIFGQIQDRSAQASLYIDNISNPGPFNSSSGVLEDKSKGIKLSVGYFW